MRTRTCSLGLIWTEGGQKRAAELVVLIAAKALPDEGPNLGRAGNVKILDVAARDSVAAYPV